MPRTLLALLAALILVLAPAAQRPALAQAQPAPPQSDLPATMSIQEYQGLGCLSVGVLGGFSAFMYSDIIAAAATGTVTNPVLLIPIVATAFAVGCSVGAMLSPGLLWLYKQVQ